MRFASGDLKLGLFLLALSCLVSPVQAADEKKTVSEFFDKPPSGKPEGGRFTQKTEDVVNASKPEDLIPYHVRCWQQGVLVVDEPNWRSPQVQMRFTAMKSLGNQDTGLYLLDFGNAFCQLKKQQ